METVFISFIHDYFSGLFDSFLNPQKRVSIIYIASAVVCAVIWGAVVSSDTWTRSLKYGFLRMFSKETWITRSTRADIFMIFINRALMMVLSPLLISRVAVTTGLFFFLHDIFGSNSGSLSELPAWVAPFAYTIFLFLFDDFSRYIVHRAMHKFAFLWAFHKVHHSAESLTPLTVLRTHPVEAIIFSLRTTFVQAITISLFVFLFGSRIELISVYGVNIFLFIFNLMAANLRHSHVAISYGPILERFFMSPAQHQLHHSIDLRHRNKNYGVVLAIWDRIGGCLILAKNGAKLKFGIDGEDTSFSHSLTQLYLQPFKEMYAAIILLTKNILGLLMKRRVYNLARFQFMQMKVFLLLFFGGLLSYTSLIDAKELNIYSHRQPFLIKPFLSEFEKETGIKTNVVFSSKGLAQRMLAEGKRSKADVVLTVDISRLHVYADKDLLTPIVSDILISNIPSYLRDPKNRWFGLSKRARVIVASNTRVKAGEIRRIEDLADQKWSGRICARPGSHVYNRALLASIIAANGEDFAEKWGHGMVANLAQRPQGNDRAQIKAIYQGVCDLAIVNSYYFGKLRHAQIPEQREWTRDTRIIFTNQEDRGNHINISGAGVAKFTKNKELAIRFLEFLSGAVAQKLYTQVNYEFPGNPKVALSNEQKSWGSFKEDKLPIGVIAKLAPKAQIIIDRIGW